MVCDGVWFVVTLFMFLHLVQTSKRQHTYTTLMHSVILMNWAYVSLEETDLRRLKTFPHWPHFISGSFLPWWTFQIWIFKVSSRDYFFRQYGHSKHFSMWWTGQCRSKACRVMNCCEHISYLIPFSPCLARSCSDNVSDRAYTFYKCCIGVF